MSRWLTGNSLVVAAAVSLVISFTPWAPWILYPFKLFTTWVHECGHAVATVLVGGSVQSITIAPDTSGLTHSLIPDRRIHGGVVASAGYLGAALVGCLLMAAARADKWAHLILPALGVFMLLTLVLWMRNLFGAGVVLVWAVVLIALARGNLGQAPRFLLGLLAIQVALNSVYDIRVLYQIRSGPSDAATMARLFLAPAWMWATLWMMMSVAMLAGTLWLTRPGRS